jgi:uncharacterized membrane protein
MWSAMEKAKYPIISLLSIFLVISIVDIHTHGMTKPIKIARNREVPMD